MQENLAQFISRLTGPPLLFPIFIYLTFYWAKVNLTHPSNLFLFGGVLFLEWILPVGFFIKELKKGKISHLDAPIREERIPVYTLTLVGWTLALFLTKLLGSSALFQWQRILYLLILVLVGFTYFYKVSVHAALNFGLYLLLNLVYSWQFFYLLPLLFLVVWSRYRIKNHNLGELIVGAVVGILTIYLGWRML